MVKDKILTWVRNVFIALDQLVNTIFGGLPDETISARSYRSSMYTGWRGMTWELVRFTIDTLALVLFADDHHCRESFESEMLRKQLPVEYRNG